jgi:hypothetical protein
MGDMVTLPAIKALDALPDHRSPSCHEAMLRL